MARTIKNKKKVTHSNTAPVPTTISRNEFNRLSDKVELLQAVITNLREQVADSVSRKRKPRTAAKKKSWWKFWR